MQSKRELRKKFRGIRKEAKKDTSFEKNLCSNILHSRFYRNSEKVFLYASSGDEADIDAVIHDALINNKKVALPACLDDKGHMEFYFIENISDIESGMYGIREPIKEKCRKAYFDKKTLCFVPAICFDRKGYRIGYGKGYYDRFLESFNGIAVGVCTESCLTDAVPHDEHDKKVNYIITDYKLHTITEEE